MAQKFVGAPFFGELDGAASQVAVILLQLRFKAAEEGESVGRRAGKSRQDLVLIQAANLLGGVLDDAFAERDLAISGHDDSAVAADAKNCGGANQTLRR